MSFQIVELALHANDNVTERKVVPDPYQTRQEAMAAAESIAAKYAGARIAMGGSGERAFSYRGNRDAATDGGKPCTLSDAFSFRVDRASSVRT